jgi:hypothetical protein
VESLSVAEAPLPNINEIKDGLSNVERLENRISMLTGNKNFVCHVYAMKRVKLTPWISAKPFGRTSK